MDIITGEQAEMVDEKRRMAEGESWKGCSDGYGATVVLMERGENGGGGAESGVVRDVLPAE